MNISNIVDIEVDGINDADYPDFVDAFAISATWASTGELLTDEELDELNQEHSDVIYETVIAKLF